MSKISHNELRLISYSLYDEYYYDCLSDWNIISIKNDSKTGLYAEVFCKDNICVIAFRGTDCNSGVIELGRDIGNDFKLALSMLPSQYKPAKEYVEEICKTEKNKQIIITGYSLGASIGQMVASQLGLSAVLFEPFGVGKIMSPKFVNNIINYGNIKDPIFVKNIDEQIGEIRVITDNKNLLTNKEIYSLTEFNINYDLKTHMPEHNGDLSKNVKYRGKTYFSNTKEMSKNSDKTLLKGYIQKSSENDNGHWVTIDGNHVLIKD